MFFSRTKVSQAFIKWHLVKKMKEAFSKSKPWKWKWNGTLAKSIWPKCDRNVISMGGKDLLNLVCSSNLGKPWKFESQVCFCVSQYSERKGLSLGVVGWVKNTNKGTVVGQVQGPRHLVNEMWVLYCIHQEIIIFQILSLIIKNEC